MSESSSDSSVDRLVRRAAAGDEAALAVLLAETRDDLHAYLMRKIPMDLQGHLDADDVIQEAHARAFQSASNFEPRGIGPFVRWVKTIALNRLRNLIQFHRAQKRGGSGRQVVASPLHDSALFLLETIDAVERTPSRSVARLEAIEAVRYAMDHLTDEHARAVELVYLRGLTVAAAAGYMNRSERAVHNLCYDAKQRLRNLLGSRSRYLTGN